MKTKEVSLINPTSFLGGLKPVGELIKVKKEKKLNGQASLDLSLNLRYKAEPKGRFSSSKL